MSNTHPVFETYTVGYLVTALASKPYSERVRLMMAEKNIKTQKELAERLNLCAATVSNRIKSGKDLAFLEEIAGL